MPRVIGRPPMVLPSCVTRRGSGYLLPVEFLCKRVDRAEFNVAPEYQPHLLGFGLVDDQRAILDLVAKRHGTAHPHALLAGGLDLVADALARDLALELGEG